MTALQDLSIEATSLVLLAHQDDEIMVAPLLVALKRERPTVVIIYLTEGGQSAAPARRNAESLRALGSLGIAASQVLFLGTEIAVPDGELFRNLARVHHHLSERLRNLEALRDIYTHAWEGGHEDHDATAVLATALAAERGIKQLWQVPFYQAAAAGPPWFSLFSPLPENGPGTEIPLTRQQALTRLKLIRFFPSQWRSWAGLGPAILWHCLSGTTFKMQHLALERLWTRPVAGRLLYEHRSGVSFEEFSSYATAFLAERGFAQKGPRLSAWERAAT